MELEGVEATIGSLKSWTQGLGVEMAASSQSAMLGAAQPVAGSPSSRRPFA
jgi:hypothetical protein